MKTKELKKRYSYIFHQEVPDNLKLDFEELSVDYMNLKREWNWLCDNYRTNPNHHFNINRGMIRDDKIYQICEIQNNWNSDKASTFSVVREIHKKGNHKFVEIAELYECLDCGVYCRSRTSILIPYIIWNGLSKGVFDIPLPYQKPPK